MPENPWLKIQKQRAEQHFRDLGRTIEPANHPTLFLAVRSDFVSVVAVVIDLASIEQTIAAINEEIARAKQLGEGLASGHVVLPEKVPTEIQPLLDRHQLSRVVLKRLRPDDLANLVARQLQGVEADIALSGIASSAINDSVSLRVQDAVRKFVRNGHEQLFVLVGTKDAVARNRSLVARTCAQEFDQPGRPAPVLVSLSQQSPARLEDAIGKVLNDHGIAHNTCDLPASVAKGVLLPIFDGLSFPLRRGHPIDLIQELLAQQGRAIVCLPGDELPNIDEIAVSFGITSEAIRIVSAPETDPPSAPLLFLLAAREDADRYFAELKRHLNPLERRYGARLFNPYQLLPGADVREESLNTLAQARIVVLLVSSHLLAAERDHVQTWLDKALKIRALVVPVIVRPCDWEDEPYGRFAPLPKDGKPLEARADREEAWTEVYHGLKELLEARR